MDGTIIDLRHPLLFGASHIEGAININMPDRFAFWAAYVIDYQSPIYFIADAVSEIEEAVKGLYRVGLDSVVGYLEGGYKSWVKAGEDFTDIPQVSVRFLDDMLDAEEPIKVIDVRTKSEWESGHIKQARHIYLGDLQSQLAKVTKNEDDQIYVICGGGYRSSVAASLIQAQGHEQIINVFGGMEAYLAAGLKVVV
jgi:hydroxyacylglutathione hydrolase